MDRYRATISWSKATYTVNSMAKPKRGRSTAAIDDHVGGRIRERRIMLGLTQQQLAEMIGVTYQQAHKYERGINRVSAGRLFEIARNVAEIRNEKHQDAVSQLTRALASG